MGRLEFTFLGMPHVRYAGQSLKFATRKTLALLIYLVVEGGMPSREKLTVLLWPDSDTKRGRASLRNTLGYLRSALDPTGEPLIIERYALGFDFNAEFDLDIHLLEVAQQALQEGTTSALQAPLQTALNVYRSDFLEGFSLGDAPDFDDWASLQREHWHRQIGMVCDRLSQMQFDAGEIDPALETVTRWIALDPWDEGAHRRLMRLHFANGDRPAALQAYDACRTMLADEFGVDPAPETEALAARLHAEASPRQKHQKASADRPYHQIDTPLIGRTVEHNQLVTVYHTARRGQPQVVVLAGQAGVGKSRLATEFLGWATGQGADVLRGQAFETGGQLPYQPVAQALRNRLEQENAPDDLLSDVWLAELSRLLPELRDRYPDLPEPSTWEEAAARQRLFEAVARLGQALAERAPVVLFIDDIQWADAASLDVLHYGLLRWQERQSPVLLLLSLRSEALSGPQGAFGAMSELQVWLSGLEHDLAPTRLTLEALSQNDTQRFVEAILGSTESKGRTTKRDEDYLRALSQIEKLGQWLYDETDGLPFFITEMLKALVEQGMLTPNPAQDGMWLVDWTAVEDESGGLSPLQGIIPSGIRGVILTRLSRLTPAASALLTAAAVLGQAASFERLCQVVDLDHLQGLPALDELLASWLLLEAEGGQRTFSGAPSYTFTHDKIRDVVYTEAGETRRRILHRRAFEAMETIAGPVKLAHHALRAGLVEPALHYSLAAGDEAMRLFAIRDAIAHYETVRQMDVQTGVPVNIPASSWQHLYTQLGRAYELSDEWDQAQAIYEAMLEYARTIGETKMECQALNRLATVYRIGIVDLETAAELLQRALAIAEENEDKLGMTETLDSLGLVARLGGNRQRASDLAVRALALARELAQPELIAHSQNSLSYANTRLRKWQAVVADAEEARAFYATEGNQAMESDCLRQVGWGRLMSGWPHEGISALRKANAISRDIEHKWGESDGGFKLVRGLVEIGAYGEALSLAKHTVTLARELGHPHLMALTLMSLGTAYRTMLALDIAQATQIEALAAQAETTFMVHPDWALAELCASYALAGNWATAYDYAQQTLAARENGTLLPMALTGWYETEALLRGGKEDLARADVHRVGEMIGDNRRYRIPYLRSLAVLAQWHGDIPQAITPLEEASSIAEEIGLAGEQWLILVALGELYQEQGNEEAAQQVISQAVEIVQSLADEIEDNELRTGFLTAGLVQGVLKGEQ